MEHGIRFPSKVETVVYHHIVAEPSAKRFIKKQRVHEITQRFKDYQFYGVRVEQTLAGYASP